jgi:hypothetical protein
LIYEKIWSSAQSQVIGREIDSADTQNLETGIFWYHYLSRLSTLLKISGIHKNSDYVFLPFVAMEAPSDSTFSKALKELLKKNNLAGKQTVHGSGMYSDRLAEGELGLSRRVIEQQMSHTCRDAKSSDKHFYDQIFMFQSAMQ